MRIRLTARALAPLMALSGGATLAGEALGARVLRPLLGSTALAQTGTLAGVLGALGFGAWWAGRALARGRVSPQRVLVAAHLGLAAWALAGALVPSWFTSGVARALVSLSERTEHGGDVARLVVALGLTAVPGALAGSAYPAAVALLSRGAGAGTAVAGAASSLGAAAAAIVTTFVLCPAVGVSWTLACVAGAYVSVAVLARGVEGGATRSRAPAVEEADEGMVAGERDVLVALLCLGVASTAWQVLLARSASLAFGPSAFSFAAALAAHVTALALGELAALRAVSRCDARGARAALGTLVVVGAVAVAASRPLLSGMARFAEHLLAGGAPSQPVLWLSAYGALVAAALPVVACVGAAMAFAARALAGEATTSHDGEANGRALGAMAVGNVLGALATTFAVMPALGLDSAALAVGLALVAAVAMVRSRPLAVVAAAALCGLMAAQRRAADPTDMLRGPFLYAGSRDVELGRLAWRRDDAEATVAVRRDDEGNVLLQINGKVDATSLGDATTQTVVGVLPVAMGRSVGDVLVVGLGSGMTADAARSVPGVRSVLVAELVGSVVDAARSDFARANHHVLDDARVRVVKADAAQFLRGTSRTFDAIVSEPSNPWVAGMSDLFTREAFEAARARLRPGGAFGAWFHAYSTSAEVVGSIVATFHDVFPRATLVEITPGQDYLLVGLRDGALDLDNVLRRVDDPTVTRMLAGANITDHASLMARFVAGARGVEAIGRGSPVLRAADLTLEFRAPSLLYRDATADVFSLLARVDDLPLAGLVADASPGGAWLRLLDESEARREAITHTRSMVLADRQGDVARALREGELAVGFDPRDPTPRALLARLYLTRAALRRVSRDPGGAEQDLTAVLELAPPVTERFRALVKLGDLAARRRDGQRALARYTEALAVARSTGEVAPELHVRMAETLAMLGAPAQAADELDQAIRSMSEGPRRRELERLRSGMTP